MGYLKFWPYLLGGIFSGLLLLFMAELYLSKIPPADLRQYMPELSNESGHYVLDEQYGIGTTGWDALQKDPDYVQKLKRNIQLTQQNQSNNEKPIWWFTGNSFILTGNHLAQTVKETAVDRNVIYAKNISEPIPVRLWTADFLLKEGFKPERMFIGIMAVDFNITMGMYPIKNMTVNQSGGIVYIPAEARKPFNHLLKRSALAQTAWVRTGMQEPYPGHRYIELYAHTPQRIFDDLEPMLRTLAETAQSNGVPITFVLNPEKRQLVNDDGYDFQNKLIPLLKKHGFDVYDARSTMLGHTDPMRFFLPDWHYTPAGVTLFRNGLYQHLGYTPPHAPDRGTP